LAKDTLTGASKDLLVAARLTEALTIEHGFAGLRDGLDLLGRLADQCWDRIYPLIEEGETADVREGPFRWLNQETYGAMFPRTVRETPFFKVGGTGYIYAHWQQSDKRGKFEAALMDATEQEIRTVAEDLAAAKEKLEHLAKVLDEKMGE